MEYLITYSEHVERQTAIAKRFYSLWESTVGSKEWTIIAEQISELRGI